MVESKEQENKEVAKLEEEVSEFVLTMSVSDYFKSGARLLPYQYEYRSVDSLATGDFNWDDTILDAKAKLMEKAKKIGAEVVVEVKPSHSHSGGYLGAYFIGTAIIPKQAEKNGKRCHGVEND